MNRAEAKRKAHDAVAALVAVNLETGDGDLFVGVEDLDDDDRARFTEACHEIANYHWRRGE